MVERLVALLGTSAAGWWSADRYPHGQGIDRRGPKLASALAVLAAGPRTPCRSARPALLSCMSSRSTTPPRSATTPVHPPSEWLCTHLRSGLLCIALPRGGNCAAPGPVHWVCCKYIRRLYTCTHPWSGLLRAASPAPRQLRHTRLNPLSLTLRHELPPPLNEHACSHLQRGGQALLPRVEVAAPHPHRAAHAARHEQGAVRLVDVCEEYNA